MQKTKNSTTSITKGLTSTFKTQNSDSLLLYYSFSVTKHFQQQNEKRSWKPKQHKPKNAKEAQELSTPSSEPISVR